MELNNKKRIVFLKRLFFLVSLGIALAVLLLFLFDLTLYAFVAIGVFALWYLFFQVADYQYVKFSNEDSKISLRYYKAVRFGGTAYNAIEFPAAILRNARFDHSVFGPMTDLTLVVKTQRGIAEYPPVSLTALSKKERTSIRNALTRNPDI